MPVTYLLGLATVLCTHRHHPGSRHSPGPRVEGVGKQDGQVGVTSSIVVVIPRVVDGFLGRPNHCRGTGKGQSRVSSGAEATLPATKQLPHFSSIFPPHTAHQPYLQECFGLPPCSSAHASLRHCILPVQCLEPLAHPMLGSSQGLPVPSRPRTHVTCW